jgi:hypothetical protein
MDEVFGRSKACQRSGELTAREAGERARHGRQLSGIEHWVSAMWQRLVHDR